MHLHTVCTPYIACLTSLELSTKELESTHLPFGSCAPNTRHQGTTPNYSYWHLTSRDFTTFWQWSLYKKKRSNNFLIYHYISLTVITVLKVGEQTYILFWMQEGTGVLNPNFTPAQQGDWVTVVANMSKSKGYMTILLNMKLDWPWLTVGCVVLTDFPQQQLSQLPYHNREWQQAVGFLGDNDK